MTDQNEMLALSLVKTIDELKAELAAMTAERDSETAWAHEYHSNQVQLEKENTALQSELEIHAWEISPAMAQARIDRLTGQNAALQKELREARAFHDNLTAAVDWAVRRLELARYAGPTHAMVDALLAILRTPHTPTANKGDARKRADMIEEGSADWQERSVNAEAELSSLRKAVGEAVQWIKAVGSIGMLPCDMECVAKAIDALTPTANKGDAPASKPDCETCKRNGNDCTHQEIPKACVCDQYAPENKGHAP